MLDYPVPTIIQLRGTLEQRLSKGWAQVPAGSVSRDRALCQDLILVETGGRYDILMTYAEAELDKQRRLQGQLINAKRKIKRKAK